MKYNAEHHSNQRQRWSKEDTEYLINWYDIIGMEEMSLALGRTERTVAYKVHKLRKQGKMSKPSVKRYTARILRTEVNGKVILPY